jgi:CrcB protein
MNIPTLYIFVAISGLAGVLTRYSINFWTTSWHGVILSIFTVNAIGSYIIGLLWKLWQIDKISQDTYIILSAGFLGGITTFSGYSLNLSLMAYAATGNVDQICAVISYAVLMPLVGLGLVVLGMMSV